MNLEHFHFSNTFRPVEIIRFLGTLEQLNNPLGQILIMITFWVEEFGFHMEIQTQKDLELNGDLYNDYAVINYDVHLGQGYQNNTHKVKRYNYIFIT